MRAFNDRERRLSIALVGTAALMGVVVGVVFVQSRFSAIDWSQREIRDEIADLEKAIAEGKEWEQRDEWIKKNQPLLPTPPGSVLLSTLADSASRAGLLLSAGTPELQRETGFFRAVIVDFSVEGELPRVISFLYWLQEPRLFHSFNDLQVSVDPKKDSVVCRGQLVAKYRPTS